MKPAAPPPKKKPAPAPPVDLHQRIAEQYLFRGIFERRKKTLDQ